MRAQGLLSDDVNLCDFEASRLATAPSALSGQRPCTGGSGRHKRAQGEIVELAIIDALARAAGAWAVRSPGNLRWAPASLCEQYGQQS
jgi:hypothetical protein